MKKLGNVLAVLAVFLILTLSVSAEDYKQTRDFDGSINPNVIQRLSDNASIPNDMGNRDWVAYLKWDQTNDAQSADPIPVPSQKALDKVKVDERVESNARTKAITELKSEGKIWRLMKL